MYSPYAAGPQAYGLVRRKQLLGAEVYGQQLSIANGCAVSARIGSTDELAVIAHEYNLIQPARAIGMH